MIFIWGSNIFHYSRFIFQLFAYIQIHNVISTLGSVVKLDVENESIVSTLSNVLNMNVETENVDSTLFNVVNFPVNVQNVV